MSGIDFLKSLMVPLVLTNVYSGSGPEMTVRME
jgi:hypothetical protein